MSDSSSSNPPTSNLVAELSEKIEHRGPDECWPWLGAKFPNGYGRVNLPRMNGKQKGTTAHRALWASLFGEPHPALEICHTCDNRACCNPRHLFVGTPKINAIDKKNKGRVARINGSRNGQSKLKEHDVAIIRTSNLSNRELAKIFGVSHANISAIRARKAWNHV